MRTYDISQEPRRLDPVLPLWLGVGGGTAVIGVGGALLLASGSARGMEHLLETYLVQEQ